MVGLASFGKRCSDHQQTDDVADDNEYYDEETTTKPAPNVNASRLLYGVYTNVANYIDWIKQNSDYSGCKRSK